MNKQRKFNRKMWNNLLTLFFAFLMQTMALAAAEVIPATPPHVIKKLYQIMYDTHHLFSAHEVEYRIEAGTLLGAVRHQGLIPWDTDLDIDLPMENIPQLLALEPIFKKLGYTFAKYPNIGYRIGYAHPMEQIYPYADIFIVERLVEGIAYATDWAKAYYSAEKCRAGHIEKYHYRLEDLYPLKQYPFGSFFVLGPAEPWYHLEKWYGTNYRDHAEIANGVNYRFKNRRKNPLQNFNLTEALLTPAKPLSKICFYTGLSSCFCQAGCNNVLSIITEPSCPQASIPVELTVLINCFRHSAAFKSLSISSWHSVHL